MTERAPLIVTRALTRTYTKGPAPVEAVRDVDLDVQRGEFLAIMGRSGSGKSTLLHLLGALDRPSSGNYHLNGVDLSTLGERALAAVRAQHIGFVFQTFHLLDELTVLENVVVPFAYRRDSRREARRRAFAALERVGLGPRTEHRPNTLSGGEMQRVAVARALVTSPELVLADEPTGNLDEQTTVSAAMPPVRGDFRTLLSPGDGETCPDLVPVGGRRETKHRSSGYGRMFWLTRKRFAGS
jgi:putative ABC transport system ATP-binding protein